MTTESPKPHTGSGRREKSLLMMGILDPLCDLLRVVFSTRSPPRPPPFVLWTLGVRAVEDQPDSSTGPPDCQGSCIKSTPFGTRVGGEGGRIAGGAGRGHDAGLGVGEHEPSGQFPAAPDRPGAAPGVGAGRGVAHPVGAARDDATDHRDRGPCEAVPLAPWGKAIHAALLARIGVGGGAGVGSRPRDAGRRGGAELFLPTRQITGRHGRYDPDE